LRNDGKEICNTVGRCADGSGARRLASGSVPRISPDGLNVAFSVVSNQRTYRPDLMLVPADGSAPPRMLGRGWHDVFTFAWSPDSKTIAAAVGPEIGARRRKYAPKNELYLMAAHGSGVRRLTKTRVGQLLQGLTPTA
jgi:Tol biopolymer transport system component